jgi:hypothetical protein
MKFGILREKESTRQKSCFSNDELLRIKSVIRMPSYKLKVQISEFSPMHNTATLKFQMTSVIVMFYLELKSSCRFLIPDKSYFFFSYDKTALQQAITTGNSWKNIDLYDHETIVNASDRRLIGFGRYAGIVGAYNTIRAFGIKFGQISQSGNAIWKEELISYLKGWFCLH